MSRADMLLKTLILSTILLIVSTSTVWADSFPFCTGNFDYDKDVDGTDAGAFKVDFGRSFYKEPCPPDAIWKIFEDGTDESVEWKDATNPRFAIYDANGNNTDDPSTYVDDLVLDKDTGLIWARNANLLGTLEDWLGARLYCMHTVTLGNRKGWRLPTIEELSSLVDTGQGSPPLPSGHPFTNVQTYYYWSSTTYEGDSTRAWLLIMTDGYVSQSNKVNSNYVWPVRGGNGYATGNW